MSLDLTAFVHKVTTIELGKQKLQFTELTLGDMAEFRGRVQEKRKATRAERSERIMKDAEALKVDPLEVLTRLDKPPTEEEYEAEAETIEGVIHLAFLSLRHKMVGISEEQVEQFIPVGNVDEIVEAMLPSVGKKKPKTLKEKRSRGDVLSQ